MVSRCGHRNTRHYINKGYNLVSEPIYKSIRMRKSAHEVIAARAAVHALENGKSNSIPNYIMEVSNLHEGERKKKGTK